MKKIGIVLNSLPLGVILLLLEYHEIISPFFPTIGYLSFLLLLPIITVLLLRTKHTRKIYRILFLTSLISILLGLMFFFLFGTLPSYWTKPFTAFGLAIVLPTFNLIIQWTFLFLINLSKGFIETLKSS